MTRASIAEQGTEVIGEKPQKGRPGCAGCGRKDVPRAQPRKLDYEESKAYKASGGPYFCMSCNPRWKELPTIDFGQVL